MTETITAAKTETSARFNGGFWQVVVAALLIALATSGCHSDGGSVQPIPGPQPAPQPVPSLSELDRAPVPVREAFRKDEDREGAKVVSVKGRLMPDGLVHYTIKSTDPKGVSHTDVYRADGVKVSAK